MSVRNPNYQQVHDLYELCSDGRSLQEFCRMSGVSYQKYLEWERNQALVESQKKLKPVSEPPVGIVTISDAPSTEQPSKTVKSDALKSRSKQKMTESFGSSGFIRNFVATNVS